MAKIISKDTKRKRTVAAIAFALCALLVGGIIAAYYSDLFRDDGTLASGNLSISVDHEVLLNNQATTLQTIAKLNPGDTVVIRGTVTNEGSQSAWARESIVFSPIESTLLPYLHVYNAEISQADLLNDVDNSASLMTLTDGTAASSNKVLDGDTTESGGGYNYVGASYNFAITIYFDKLAGNDTQNATISLSFIVEALQFANNNATQPLESAWATVFAR